MYKKVAIFTAAAAVGAMVAIDINALRPDDYPKNLPVAEHIEDNGQTKPIQKANLASPALGDRAQPAVYANVHIGNISEWKAPDDRTLFVKDIDNQWYRASFFGPCVGLSQTKNPQFAPELSGYLDHTSSVVVSGERCAFKSFKKTSLPPVHNSAKKGQRS